MNLTTISSAATANSSARPANNTTNTAFTTMRGQLSQFFGAQTATADAVKFGNPNQKGSGGFNAFA
ncbi:MAG: hypothetical protein K2X01_05530 [Cyanobacteria bacterium]|nr:hypothetical protein [Cyanobacteriota bacterium]